MIKSMTGFGRGDYADNGYQFNVEIKTINHRYTDFFIRMPRHISYLEEKIKKHIQKYISRGRIELYVTLDYIDKSDVEVDINLPLAKGYYKALEKLSKELSIDNNITVMDIAKFQDVIKTTKTEEDEDALFQTLIAALDKAMENLFNMRKTEGQKLYDDMYGRINSILSLLQDIEKYAPLVVEEYRLKLLGRIKDLEKDNIILDQNRIITEVAIFADRSNINEEITRLNSHISQFLDTIKSEEPVGRKLDFLIQEMNREVNTIGSKANYVDITKIVVEIKSELEKIREQIQNIE
jgi:uncharacterized protein (TIGR00255 family)